MLFPDSTPAVGWCVTFASLRKKTWAELLFLSFPCPAPSMAAHDHPIHCWGPPSPGAGPTLLRGQSVAWGQEYLTLALSKTTVSSGKQTKIHLFGLFPSLRFGTRAV